MKPLFLMVISTFILFANQPQNDANLSDINKTLEIVGDVKINGKRAKSDMKVNLGDFVETGKDSKIKFNVGKDAFMVKSNSKISIKEEFKGTGINTLNLLTGSVVGVFKTGSKYNLKTHNMTAGTRGTGIYLETDQNKTYFCTCYGKTEVHSHTDKEKLNSIYHKMVVIESNGTIAPTKEMRNHTDDELRKLEKKVGRIPDFDKIIEGNDC